MMTNNTCGDIWHLMMTNNTCGDIWHLMMTNNTCGDKWQLMMTDNTCGGDMTFYKGAIYKIILEPLSSLQLGIYVPIYINNIPLITNQMLI